VACHDVALLDLDGVVYVGPQPVRGAVEALAEVRRLGMRLAFVTNNASRAPDAVAAQLVGLGIPAAPSEVVTSAQAAAHYLADRLPVGARVLVLGTAALADEVAARGLRPVRGADDEPRAVVQGYSKDLGGRELAEAALAIRAGALWVATNTDATLPSPRGLLPGNGSLVAALRCATGQDPVVTGKPAPTMHFESIERSTADRPLVVGDRLETDIEGATSVGCPALLVLTGVTDPALLLAAEPARRPDYVAADLGGLLVAHSAPVGDASGARCGGWTVAGDRLAGDGDPIDALRALCAVSWGEGAPPPRWRADGDAAERALDALRLG